MHNNTHYIRLYHDCTHYISIISIMDIIHIISIDLCFCWMSMEVTVYVHKLPQCDSCVHLEYHVPEHWQWNTCTSSKRNGLAVAWISASRSKGELLWAMTVQGVTCIKLADTVGTSEPNILRKAMLHSWSHNARTSKQTAVPWNVPCGKLASR